MLKRSLKQGLISVIYPRPLFNSDLSLSLSISSINVFSELLLLYTRVDLSVFFFLSAFRKYTFSTSPDWA